MSGASGRSGTWRFQKNRPIVLATSDRCGLCGHHGARTVDHIIAKPDWPRDLTGKMWPGFDDLRNLQPAHGTMGSNATRKQPDNPCPVCGRLCNQRKGSGQRRRVRGTQAWLP